MGYDWPYTYQTELLRKDSEKHTLQMINSAFSFFAHVNGHMKSDGGHFGSRVSRREDLPADLEMCLVPTVGFGGSQVIERQTELRKEDRKI